jgi:hypothetical protein
MTSDCLPIARSLLVVNRVIGCWLEHCKDDIGLFVVGYITANVKKGLFDLSR